jgi:hypothetical protein
MWNGFAEIIWVISRVLRWCAWHLRLVRHTWLVVQLPARGGYRTDRPERQRLLDSFDEAVRLAEQWRAEVTSTTPGAG